MHFKSKTLLELLNIGTEFTSLNLYILRVLESVLCLKVVVNCSEEMDRKHQFKRKSESASVMREKRRRERRGMRTVCLQAYMYVSGIG